MPARTESSRTGDREDASMNRNSHCTVSAFAIAVLSGSFSTGTVRAQSWQPLANRPPFNSVSTALLLTDGTVMVHEGCTPNWYNLRPDPFGSYVTGTWTRLASMQPTYGPLYYA